VWKIIVLCLTLVPYLPAWLELCCIQFMISKCLLMCVKCKSCSALVWLYHGQQNSSSFIFRMILAKLGRFSSLLPLETADKYAMKLNYLLLCCKSCWLSECLFLQQLFKLKSGARSFIYSKYVNALMKIQISQGKAVTYLMQCGSIFSCLFCSLYQNARVKELLKWVHIGQSCHTNKTDPQWINHDACVQIDRGELQ